MENELINAWFDLRWWRLRIAAVRQMGHRNGMNKRDAFEARANYVKALAVWTSLQLKRDECKT